MTFESLNLQDENSDLNKIQTTRKTCTYCVRYLLISLCLATVYGYSQLFHFPLACIQHTVYITFCKLFSSCNYSSVWLTINSTIQSTHISMPTWENQKLQQAIVLYLSHGHFYYKYTMWFVFVLTLLEQVGDSYWPKLKQLPLNCHRNQKSSVALILFSAYLF